MSVLSREIPGDTQNQSWGWRWVMRVVSIAPFATAMLFATAAGLKVHYLRNYPILEGGFISSRVFSTGLLEAELLLAALLVYPRSRTIAVSVSIVLLTAFIAYTIALWVQNVDVCGCLGFLSTRPEVMAATDTVFALSLWAWLWLAVRGNECHNRSAVHMRPGIVALTIALIMGAAYGLSQGRAYAAGLPIGIEVTPDTLDFGDVAENGSKTGELTIINHRTEEVRILEVRTGCSCTTAIRGKSELASGEAGTVTVTFKASAPSTGLVHGMLAIKMESGGRDDELPIAFVARVVADRRIAVFPEIVDFGEVAGGTIAHKVIYFRAARDGFSQLPDSIDISSTMSTFTLSADFGESPGMSAIKELDVAFVAPTTLDEHRYVGWLVVKDLNTIALPERRIPIRARVLPSIRVAPAQLIFFTPPDTSEISSQFTITSSAGELLELASFEGDPRLRIELLSPSHSKKLTASVRLDEGRTEKHENDASLIRVHLSKPAVSIDVPVVIIREPTPFGS